MSVFSLELKTSNSKTWSPCSEGQLRQEGLEGKMVLGRVWVLGRLREGRDLVELSGWFQVLHLKLRD